MRYVLIMELSDKDIEKAHEELRVHWEKNLKSEGVKFPRLKMKGKFTKDCLVLVYLYLNMEKSVTKEELTTFVNKYHPKTLDVQQGRHLAAQNGWYIISKTRKDLEAEEKGLKKGEYMLLSLEKSYPKFSYKRRTCEIDENGWEDLKNQYDYRCATCGSKEGEPNIHYPNTITKLQKGHMDPSKPLESGNIFPQCEKCNRPDRNYFVYNPKGRVIKIADPNFVSRSSKSVRLEMLKILKKELE